MLRDAVLDNIWLRVPTATATDTVLTVTIRSGSSCGPDTARPACRSSFLRKNPLQRNRSLYRIPVPSGWPRGNWCYSRCLVDPSFTGIVSKAFLRGLRTRPGALNGLPLEQANRRSNQRTQPRRCYEHVPGELPVPSFPHVIRHIYRWCLVLLQVRCVLYAHRLCNHVGIHIFNHLHGKIPRTTAARHGK